LSPAQGGNKHTCGLKYTNKHRALDRHRCYPVQWFDQLGAKLRSGTLAIAETKPTHRAAVTNGSAVLPGIDGRSTWARRLRDLIELHLNDLGGPEAVSQAQHSIVRRAATLTVELERLEAKFANAGAADSGELDLYQRTAGNLRRLLESVGFERKARNVTPGLREYLAAKRGVE
jgi:hypothetical protein